ncbi:unnamed protein product [Closterium sp. NIES-53]
MAVHFLLFLFFLLFLLLFLLMFLLMFLLPAAYRLAPLTPHLLLSLAQQTPPYPLPPLLPPRPMLPPSTHIPPFPPPLPTNTHNLHSSFLLHPTPTIGRPLHSTPLLTLLPPSPIPGLAPATPTARHASLSSSKSPSASAKAGPHLSPSRQLPACSALPVAGSHSTRSWSVRRNSAQDSGCFCA